jgi:hypothetical protein
MENITFNTSKRKPCRLKHSLLKRKFNKLLHVQILLRRLLCNFIRYFAKYDCSCSQLPSIIEKINFCTKSFLIIHRSDVVFTNQVAPCFLLLLGSLRSVRKSEICAKKSYGVNKIVIKSIFKKIPPNRTFATTKQPQHHISIFDLAY